MDANEGGGAPMWEQLLIVVCDQINRCRATSFHMFAVDPRACCAPYSYWSNEYQASTMLKDEDGTTFTTFLTFVSGNDPGDARCVTLPVRTTRSKYFGLTDPKIWWHAEWVPLMSHCEIVFCAPPYSPPVGEIGYDTLWRWYKFRGLPFRILDLPKEMRYLIYEYIVGDDIYPKTGLLASGAVAACIGAGWPPKTLRKMSGEMHDPEAVVPPPKADIMHLNRQIRSEAAQVIWRSCRLSFTSPKVLDRMSWVANSMPGNILRHIGLNFENCEYARFFRVSESEGFPMASLLRQETLPNLMQLDIKFRPMHWEGGWKLFGKSICQEICAEVILTFAFEHVRHIPAVTVEGYVKGITKQNFAKALEELKQDASKQQPGLETWGINKSDIIVSGQSYLLSQCHCIPPCGS